MRTCYVAATVNRFRPGYRLADLPDAYICIPIAPAILEVLRAVSYRYAVPDFHIVNVPAVAFVGPVGAAVRRVIERQPHRLAGVGRQFNTNTRPVAAAGQLSRSRQGGPFAPETAVPSRYLNVADVVGAVRIGLPETKLHTFIINDSRQNLFRTDQSTVGVGWIGAIQNRAGTLGPAMCRTRPNRRLTDLPDAVVYGPVRQACLEILICNMG